MLDKEKERKVMKKISSAILIIFIVFSLVGGANIIQATDTRIGLSLQEIFPDPKLASAVATKLNKTSTADILTESDIEITKSISFVGLGIESIVGLSVFSNLESLTLSNNNITEISSEIGSLSKLYLFRATNNKIVNVPTEFGDLTSLKYLYLENNLITALPDTIGQLEKLDTFIVDNNFLTALPDSIVQAQQLTYLSVNDNYIANLPQDIGFLFNLRTLSLNNIQISNLPISFFSLYNLRYLWLNGNLIGTNSDINSILRGRMPNLFTIAIMGQDQLMLKADASAIVIQKGDDFSRVALADAVELLSGRSLSSENSYILEDYVNENMEPENIEDYLQDGVVVKEGILFAKVRSISTGIFMNMSNYAVTVDRIQVNFEKLPIPSYVVSFDLNGGDSEIPPSVSVMVGTLISEPSRPSREKYEFLGWNTESNAIGINWDFMSMEMPPNDFTLFAQWELETTGPMEETTGPMEETTGPMEETTGPMEETTGPMEWYQ